MSVFKYYLKPNDDIVIIDGNLVVNCKGKDLIDMSPEWNGEFSIGDIITTDDGKKRITEIEINFPDKDDENTKYVLKLK
ncbi:MAG TPA: hypothetical protein DDY71_09900 [Spirochaetia bacterium]|nr:hypothetical protein [Spirochaetia bacterium]